MKRKIALFILLFQAFPIAACAFSFSEEEAKDRRAAEAEAARTYELMSTPCKKSLKGKKIALLVAERHSGSLKVSGHGLLFNELNSQLRSLGLRTYTRGQINAAVAAAEARAILNNDPDAALAASSRLGASFFVRGVISSRSGKNMMVNANEVAVTIKLTLTDARGRVLSRQSIKAESWAGQDVTGAALSLVEDNGPAAVAQLYADYCSRAGK